MERKKLSYSMFHIGQKLFLRRMFRSMRVKLSQIEQPSIIIVNHSSFYDALVLFELDRRGYLPKNRIVGMSADGLKKFPIFKKLGTVPISQPIKLSEYKELLRLAQTHTIILFPQGVEEHAEKRPLTIQPGVERLMSRFPKYKLLFISIYYSFTDGVRGDIACQLTPKAQPVNIQQMMTTEIDTLKASVITNDLKGFTRLW